MGLMRGPSFAAVGMLRRLVGEWIALAMGAGVVGTVLLFAFRDQGLDGYGLPKELVVHAVAVLCLISAGASWRWTRADTVLLASLILGAGSAVLGATNSWWAWRALALAGSGCVIYWRVRSLRSAADRELLVAAVATAWAVGALVVLFEAAGLIPSISMAGRAPGATTGNRNFMAHGIVVAVPALVFLLMRVRTTLAVVACAMGLAASVAAVLVSRSRAAWLVGSVVLFACALLSLGQRRLPLSGPQWAFRILLFGGAVVVGLSMMVLEPAALRWRDEAPYWNTLRRIGELETGTGRGRIVQYGATARMIAAHPILGVGPGNWSVVYPRFSMADDPNYQPTALQPVNRLPNGDWLGVASEWGVIAAFCLLAAGAGVALSLLRHLKRGDDFSQKLWSALGAVAIIGACGLGLVDPVLLRPEPLITLAVLVGCPVGVGEKEPATVRVRAALRLGAMALTCVTIIMIGGRIASLGLRARGGRQNLSRAATIDPGNYALSAELAVAAVGDGQCRQAAEYASRTMQLYPSHYIGTVVEKACRESRGDWYQAPLHRSATLGGSRGQLPER